MYVIVTTYVLLKHVSFISTDSQVNILLHNTYPIVILKKITLLHNLRVIRIQRIIKYVTDSSEKRLWDHVVELLQWYNLYRRQRQLL